MRKFNNLILILSLIISVLFLSIPLFTAKSNYISIEPESTRSFTKAFCNESNLCEDYFIECNGKDVVSLTSTGFAVQFSEDWKDPRLKSEIESFC